MRKHFFLLTTVLLFLIACSKPQKPEFINLKNVKFNNISLPPKFEVSFAADAVFHNPNAVSVKMEHMDIDVYVNNKKASKIEQNLQSEIPANADFSLPIKIRLPLVERDFIENLSHMLTGAWKKKAVKIKLVGQVKLKAASVPIPITIDHEEEFKLKDYL